MSQFDEDFEDDLLIGPSDEDTDGEDGEEVEELRIPENWEGDVG